MNDSADGLLDQWLNRRGTPAADRLAPEVEPDPVVDAEAATDEAVLGTTEADTYDAEIIDVDLVEVDLVEVDLVEVDLVEVDPVEAEDVDGDVVDVEIVEVETLEVVDEDGDLVEVIEVVEVTEMTEVFVDEHSTPEMSSLSEIGDELARMATEPISPRRLPSDDAASAVLAAFAALDALPPTDPVDDSEPAEVAEAPVVEPDMHAEPDPAEEMVEEGSPIDPDHPLPTEEPEAPVATEPEPAPEPTPEPAPAPAPTLVAEPVLAPPTEPSVDDIVASLDIPGLAPLSASTSALLASLTAPVAPVAPAAPVAPTAAEPEQVTAGESPAEAPLDDLSPAVAEPEPVVEPEPEPGAEPDAVQEPAAAPATEPVHAIAMPAAGQHYEHTFAPPKQRSGLPTVLLFAGVLVTLGACWWAFESRTVAAIAIAGVAGVATAILWAARAGDAASRLYVRGSRLMIERAGTRTQFDLADPHTPLTITGSVETGDWRATFERRGMSPVVIDSTMVDPTEFMYVVETYRPS